MSNQDPDKSVNTQNMKQLRATQPVAAMMMEIMKNDLLIVLFNRLGGNVEIPVKEIDDVGGIALSMVLEKDNTVFRFTTTRADGSPVVTPKAAPTWPPKERTRCSTDDPEEVLVRPVPGPTADLYQAGYSYDSEPPENWFDCSKETFDFGPADMTEGCTRQVRALQIIR